jgi:hypothetical protein
LPKKKPGDEPEETFESIIDGLPNDLGGVADSGEPSIPDDDQFASISSIKRFNNADLECEGRLDEDELQAMLRLFPADEIVGGMIGCPSSEVRELAIAKLYRLAGALRKTFELRTFLEEQGADCDGDLVMSILSVVGEMGRLRTLLPKLSGSEAIEADASDD